MPASVQGTQLFSSDGLTRLYLSNATEPNGQGVFINPLLGGYRLPLVDGSSGQVISTNGTGASTWTERSIIGTSPIVVTNGNGVSGNPTVSVTGGGLPWTVVTGASQAAAVNSGYICNRGAGVTVTLPDTAAVGSILRIAGMDGNWVLAQNAGETIYFGTSATTTGAGGSLTATDNRDCIELVCTVADQDWVVTSSVGNITVT